MKKVLLLTFMLATSITATSFANDAIGIFADAAGMSFELSGGPGIALYYYVHINTYGATGSRWAAPHPACLNATRFADLPVFPINLGNTEAGITIGYGQCESGSFLIMTSVYYVTSATDCCSWRVVPDPNVLSGKIEIQDCNFGLTYGYGGEGMIHRTPACPWVATEDTTWGRVKVLYSE
jgi:hypothetical protein